MPKFPREIILDELTKILVIPSLFFLAVSRGSSHLEMLPHPQKSSSCTHFVSLWLITSSFTVFYADMNMATLMNTDLKSTIYLFYTCYTQDTHGSMWKARRKTTLICWKVCNWRIFSLEQHQVITIWGATAERMN